MNVETKLELGQKVWIIESRPLKSETCSTCGRFDLNVELAARQVEIGEIAVKIGALGEVKQTWYTVADNGDLLEPLTRSEDHIFASQQECFDAIAKQKEHLNVR